MEDVTSSSTNHNASRGAGRSNVERLDRSRALDEAVFGVINQLPAKAGSIVAKPGATGWVRT